MHHHTWQMPLWHMRHNFTIMRKMRRGKVVLVFRESCIRHRHAWTGGRGGNQRCCRCFFFVILGFFEFFFNDASYGVVERSPDSLCADEADDIGQDGLTVIEKRGENTCQWAPSEGVFKDFGGFSSVPAVLPADRGILTVTGGEAEYRSANAAKRCQGLLLLFGLSPRPPGQARDKIY